MSAQRPVSLHSSPAVYAPVPASTLPLYRRLLFPSLLQATLPPAVFLHGTPELDVATYELIAVILRSHVTPWYARLTRDRTFVPQVSAVIVHLLKEIEGRVLAADLPLLVYTTLPALVEQHYADYRAARLRHSLSSSSSISDCFTALQPHVALSPNSTSVNTEYIRQAIDHVLKTCLLEEDWEAESERTIVREVLAGPVLGGVLPRLAQPWFLFGLLLSAVGKGTGPKVPDQPVAKPPVTSMRQMLVLFINTLHSLTSVLHSVVSFLQAISRFLSTLPANKGASKPRYYASSLLLVVAAILNLSARLVSGLLLSYLSIIVALLQPLLDRILSHVLYSYVLTTPNIITMMRRANTLLYPNGQPAPPTIEPPADDQLRTRQQLESRLSNSLPMALSSLLLGATTEARAHIAHEILQPLSDANCNIHLVIRLLDAILLCLFPELAADSPVPVPNVHAIIPVPEELKVDSDSESNKEGFATPLSH